MQQDFLTILIFMLFGGAFVLVNMVAIGRLLRAKTNYTEQKSTSYECGEPTFGSAFVRFDIRFYVLALVFVIFDVEVLFLFPWAVVLKEMGPLALVEAAIFILVLAVGLAYVWRKGDVDWIPMHGHDKPGARLANDDLPGGTAAAATPPTPVGAGAEG